MVKQSINSYQNGGFWQELGRATSSSSATTALPVTTFATKKYLLILITIHSGSSVSVAPVLQFNGDTTATYKSRLGENGGADAVRTTDVGYYFGSNALSGAHTEISIVNEAGYPKVGHGILTFFDGANLYRDTSAWMWPNTTTAITSAVLTVTAGTLYPGSEIVILGHN